MIYKRSGFQIIFTYIFTICIALLGLGMLYGSFLLASTYRAGILAVLGSIVFGLCCFWLVWFILVKTPVAIEINGNQISIDHIVWKEQLQNINKLEYRLELGYRGGRDTSLLIYHSKGVQKVLFLSFSNYKDMFDSLQTATGKMIENIDQFNSGL